jgi:hypothetical protein
MKTSKFDRLNVFFRKGDERIKIGELERNSNGYIYRPVTNPISTPFMLLPLNDNDINKARESTRLFGTFSKRIPSKKRPDFQAMMTKWQVEDVDDEMEILARSKGRLLTDPWELDLFDE